MKGISFDGVHSYTDLNLVLSSVMIPPATPKTNFVDIPAGDGSVDLSEALGEVKFNDREATFVFTVFPSDNFEVKKKEVSNLINGKRMEIIVDKDPNYYWVGRCSVNEYASDKNIHQITVGATLSPYKYKHNVTTKTVTSGDHNLVNGRKTVIPTITVTASTVIVFNDNTYNLSTGTHKVLGIRLVEGDNAITVTSDGQVTFKYQEGDL